MVRSRSDPYEVFEPPLTDWIAVSTYRHWKSPSTDSSSPPRQAFLSSSLSFTSSSSSLNPSIHRRLSLRDRPDKWSLLLSLSQDPRQQRQQKHFSTSSRCHKSSHKSAFPTPSTTEKGNENDPFDTTDLQAAISRAHEKLTAELSKLRPGGRFNPEVLEGLRVAIPNSDRNAGKGASGGGEKGRGGRKGGSGGGGDGRGGIEGVGVERIQLGDVAQVIPRGRTIVVLVSEKEVMFIFIPPSILLLASIYY